MTTATTATSAIPAIAANQMRSHSRCAQPVAAAAFTVSLPGSGRAALMLPPSRCALSPRGGASAFGAAGRRSCLLIAREDVPGAAYRDDALRCAWIFLDRGADARDMD